MAESSGRFSFRSDKFQYLARRIHLARLLVVYGGVLGDRERLGAEIEHFVRRRRAVGAELELNADVCHNVKQ